MLISFNENYECLINGTSKIRLGDMLCELLNYDAESIIQIHSEMGSLLHSLDPTSDDIYEGTVYHYAALMKEKLFMIKIYRMQMKKLPFYRFNQDNNNDLDAAFSPFDNFMDDMYSQLSQQEPDILIPDADISYSPDSYHEATASINNFLSIVYRTQECFRQIVDTCLLYDAEPVGTRPLNKLMAYGLDKFNKQVIPLVNNTHAASFPPLSLTYEIAGDDENQLLLPCFDFASLPQYLYHEFMKMVAGNLYVRRCKNCGQYFVIYGERILEYCNNIPQGSTKPCSAIGPSKLYNQKVKDDPILEVYTRAYKKYVARKRSGSLSEKDFKAWTVKARRLRETAYKMKITPEIFAGWLQ